MTAYLILAGVLCVIYLKWWPGSHRIKNCPRPFIVIPVLAVALVGFPEYGFYKFMMFLNRATISIDCPLAPPINVMPAEGVLYELQLSNYPGDPEKKRAWQNFSRSRIGNATHRSRAIYIQMSGHKSWA